MARKLQNPVLRGFHPDPTICQVGGTFYLACSSFEFSPGVPVFQSTDLVNWKQICNALERPSQLPLQACRPSQGIFAPTLRFHGGRYFLVSTNVGQGGNFLVTASNPAGPWSDPIWIDDAWFDPSLFFDEDGKVYYTRRGGTSSIVQAEIDPNTGKLLTPLREIASGMISPDCEGPHLYRIGEWYYLLLAEGGSRHGHMVTIARSHSPWGPFSPAPDNPILSNRSLTNNAVRATGHGELFNAPDGTWWIAFLGTRHEHYENYGLLGRETFILPVSWDSAGWPTVNHGRPVDLAPIDLPWSSAPAEVDRVEWNFSGSREEALDLGWLHLRERRGVSFRDAFGLTLTATSDSLDDCGAPAFVGRRLPSFHTSVSAELELLSSGECGLTLLLDHRHHSELIVGGDDEGFFIEARLKIGDASCSFARERVGSARVVLQIALNGVIATGSARLASGKVISFGSWDVRYFSPEVVGAWTGVVAGAFAQRGATARLLTFSLV